LRFRSEYTILKIQSRINTLRRYPDDWRSKNFYSGLIERSGKASDCIGCGQCESVCPQHLPIIELLQEAAEVLGK